MNRGIRVQIPSVCVFALALCFAGDTDGQGRGLLNQVDVSDAGLLNGIKEILAFTAFEPDPKNGTIKFVFEFEDLKHNTGISPTLIIRRGGKRIAHVRPEVFFDETGVIRKKPYNMIEFNLSPEFVRDSTLLIQFFPNTEKLVTYEIGLVAATILALKDEVVIKIPILKRLEAWESGTEQGADDQVPTRTESKAE